MKEEDKGEMRTKSEEEIEETYRECGERRGEEKEVGKRQTREE